MGILNWLFGKNESINVDITQKYFSDHQFQNSIRIIDESIKIINKTKNIQTAISRFEVIKTNFEELFNYIPNGHKLNLTLGAFEFNTLNDLYKIDEMKSEFLSSKFKGEDKKEEVYSKSLSEWVKLFNKSIEDDIITEDELIALENLQENLGLNEKDTEIYWEKYKGTLPVKSNQEVINYDELNSINNDNWKLILQFGKSQSNIFKMVLSSIEVLPTYRKFTGKNNEEIFEVTFSPNEILEFDTLWSKVKSWKSTIVKINDEIIESKTLSKMLMCFRDKVKDKDINPLFCYGASPFTFNIFGCHRTMLRDGVIASQKCWYHIGRFDKNDLFHVDKAAIKALLLKNVYHYKICPALIARNLKRGFELIPDTIDPRRDKNWEIQTDYNGVKYLIPTLQYKEYSGPTITERVGDKYVTLTSSIAMIDYTASISPQFNELLKTLFQK